VDCPIPEARLYRDYVIDSFSADLPYDEFLREQIAGDILAFRNPEHRFRERIIATGFLALSLRNGIFKHYHPELIIEDTINTIGRSMLGLTIGCSRCHDHKFEPISTADYYRFYGIFASSRYPFSGSELPQFSAGESVLMATPDQLASLPKEHRTAIRGLRATIDRTIAGHPVQKVLARKRKRLAGDRRRYEAIRKGGGFDPALRTSLDDQDVRIREDISKLDHSVRRVWFDLKSAERRAGFERAYAMREAVPTNVPIQVGGDPFDPGRVVQRGIPAGMMFGDPLEIPAGESGRRQLADWIASSKNRLTPRVAVNYVWQFHFGRGIVTTPDDLGFEGDRPTHPKLLDWLTRDFVDHGWSLKHLHRRILTSRAWRLSADAGDPEYRDAQTRDPSNRWWWHHDRRRLDAESIRDGMMQVAGTLDRSRPGAHPFPNENSWQFSQHGPFKAVYESKHRSVYLMTQRLQRHPFLTLFDGPDTSRPTVIRQSSSKPLQGLYLRNSGFVQVQARQWASRLVASSKAPNDRIREAIRRAWLREPFPGEVDVLANYVTTFGSALESARNGVADGSVSAKLELEYTFDGNTDDSSGGDHDGKMIGNPRFVPGHRGQCLSLDGDGDYVDSGLVMDFGDSFAVECWVRPAAVQAVYADIFGNHLGRSSRGFVLQQAGNKTNQFTGSIGIGGEAWVLTRAVTLRPGRWQHVALVRTPRFLALFVDGKRAQVQATKEKMRPSELPLLVGLGITLPKRCFAGEIDDLRVYRGVPSRYRDLVPANEIELASWTSLCRLLLTANEFLYVD